MDTTIPLPNAAPLNLAGQSRADRLLKQMQGLRSGRPHLEKEGVDTGLMDAARQFEGLLVHQLVKAMRSTVPKSGLMDSFAMGQYQTMLDEEIAFSMVKRKGLGLSEIFYRQLKKLEDQAGSAVNASRTVGKA